MQGVFEIQLSTRDEIGNFFLSLNCELLEFALHIKLSRIVPEGRCIIGADSITFL